MVVVVGCDVQGRPGKKSYKKENKRLLSEAITHLGPDICMLASGP